MCVSLSFNVNHHLINAALRAGAVARSDKGLGVEKPGEGGPALSQRGTRRGSSICACDRVCVLQGCRVRLCMSNVGLLFQVSRLL